MASQVKPNCRVCGKSFKTISGRNKHERVNKKCSEVEKTQIHIEERDSMIRHDAGEEGASVEFVLDDGVGSEKRCSFCLHEFEQVFNAQRHLCLLLPGVGPEYKVLKLAEDDASLEFKQLHRFNSSYQNLRTCLIVGQAVPGVFPLIFPGNQVVGRAAKSLTSRLQGLGSVGSLAYSTLRKSLREVSELRLPLCYTIYLPDGNVVSLGRELTFPTHLKQLRGLEARVHGNEIVVTRSVHQGEGNHPVSGGGGPALNDEDDGGGGDARECHGGVWWEQTWRNLVGDSGESDWVRDGEGSLSDRQGGGRGEEGGGPPDGDQGAGGGDGGGPPDGGGGGDGGRPPGGGGGPPGGGGGGPSGGGGGGDVGRPSVGDGGEDGGGPPGGGGGGDGGGPPGGDRPGLQAAQGNRPPHQQLRLNSFLRHPEYMNDNQLHQVFRITHALTWRCIFLPGTSHDEGTVCAFLRKNCCSFHRLLQGGFIPFCKMLLDTLPPSTWQHLG